MANCLAAAASTGSRSIVCDRPNPIGGIAVEGPMLRHGFESFVGLYPIPMRHGMTIGELARLFNEHFGIGADLEVVPMEGWRRDMYLDETRPAVGDAVAEHADARHRDRLSRAPCCSKARMSRKAAAPRGPFELIGAPGVAAERFADELNAVGLPGVFFRPAVFEPTFHKHAKAAAAAARFTCSIAARFAPVLTGVALVAAFRAADPAASAGAIRRTSTSTRSCRSTSWRDRRSCENRLRRDGRARKSRDRGSRTSRSS